MCVADFAQSDLEHNSWIAVNLHQICHTFVHYIFLLFKNYLDFVIQPKFETFQHQINQWKCPSLQTTNGQEKYSENSIHCFMLLCYMLVPKPDLLNHQSPWVFPESKHAFVPFCIPKLHCESICVSDILQGLSNCPEEIAALF